MKLSEMSSSHSSNETVNCYVTQNFNNKQTKTLNAKPSHVQNVMIGISIIPSYHLGVGGLRHPALRPQFRPNARVISIISTSISNNYNNALCRNIYHRVNANEIACS